MIIPRKYSGSVLLGVAFLGSIAWFSVVSAEDTGSAPVADNTSTASVSNLGPYGGDLWDTAIDADAGYVYTVAKDSPNGFYRSSDGGATWTGMTDMDVGGGVAVEVNPNNGDVYATFSSGLFKSTDHGATFTSVLSDSGNGMIYAQGLLMMASNNNQGAVVISTDDGATFDTATIASGVSIWWLDSSATAGTFYALGFDSSGVAHVYRSVDSGASWSELSIPSLTDNSSSSRVCSNPTDPTNLILTGGSSNSTYYSTNSGSSWTVTAPQSQSCVFDSTGRVYVGEQYSDDKGLNWSAVGQDGTNETATGGHGIVIDPSNVDVLYVDGMPGLSKSIDRGATWTDVNEGISGVTITDVSQANDKDIVWAAAYNGIAKTSNFTSGTPDWQFPILEDPGTAIWADPANPDVAVVGEIGAIKRTTDGGTTWSDSLTDAFFSHDHSAGEIMADVSDSNILYAAIQNGEPNTSKTGMVLKSNDQGLTWEDMGLLDGASAQTLSQASNGDLYVGAGAEGGTSYKKGIYKYSSGTWSHLENSPDEEVVKVIVDPTDDNVIYAVASIAYGNGDTGNFGFYLSQDAGDTWTKITNGLSQNREYKSLAIQTSTTPHTLYLGASNQFSQGVLYKSSDAGQTWGTFYTGLQDESFYTLLFDGVTAGTSRGLFDLKSKASLSIKVADKKIPVMTKADLTVTLKDAVTNKKLKNQTVKLYKKTSSGFVFVAKTKTNAKGKAEFFVKLKSAKKFKFQVRWTPKHSSTQEYTAAHSSSVVVTAT